MMHTVGDLLPLLPSLDFLILFLLLMIVLEGHGFIL